MKKTKQIHLTIPMDNIPSLNALYAANHHHRSKLARTAHDAVVWRVREAMGPEIESLPGPVIVTITAFAEHPRDPDNIAKVLLDGLVESGVLRSDDWRYIAELRLRSRKDPANERFEVSITKER